ncbi:MAG: tRNA (cytidine(34)-2'-O)-methyltransferase [Bdellovibrionales bacterium]|nr:tRNA (cytidine(34)-2'-O)-methyltransferase [Bdellovibrionales bacterium]
MSFNIVLVEPQIPPNTGNIGRLTIATHTRLHLVEPLGFDISEKAVRRAGLDYWKHVDLTIHGSWGAFRGALPPEARLWLFSKYAKRSVYDADFSPGDWLVFGKETTGLSEEIQQAEDPSRLLRVPMPGSDVVRSLNLAGTVHIALYEAMRKSRVI